MEHYRSNMHILIVSNVIIILLPFISISPNFDRQLFVNELTNKYQPIITEYCSNEVL